MRTEGRNKTMNRKHWKRFWVMFAVTTLLLKLPAIVRANHPGEETGGATTTELVFNMSGCTATPLPAPILDAIDADHLHNE